MSVHIPRLHLPNMLANLRTPKLPKRHYDRIVLTTIVVAFAAIIGLAIAGMIYGDPPMGTMPTL